MEKNKPTSWLRIETDETHTGIDVHGTAEELGNLLINVMKSDKNLQVVITAAALTLLLADKIGGPEQKLEEILSNNPSKFTA